MRSTRAVGRAATTLLLACQAMFGPVTGDPADDLGNLLAQIEGVPADATAQAQSAARKAYEDLAYCFRTAPDGLVNTAIGNAQYVDEKQKAIEDLARNTLAVRAGDLTASVTALRACTDTLRAAALETVSIVDAVTELNQSFAAELTPGKRAGPLASAIEEAISSERLAATESQKLPASVMAWSAAMEKVSRLASQFAAAVSRGMYRDLAVEVIQLRRANDDLGRCFNNIKSQAGVTKAAVDLGRSKLSATGPDAAVTVKQAQARLARTASVVDQISASLAALSLSCNQCTNAIDLYSSTHARLWMDSRSAFVNTLPTHLRSAMEDCDKSVSRAHSLSTAVKLSVDLALSAAQTRAASPDSGLRAAVSDRSQGLLKLLRAHADRIRELDVTAVAAEVNSLVSLASEQVAAAVQAVVEIAAPDRAKAESQLSELTSIARHMTQIRQQLTRHANGPGMIPRPGHAFAEERPLPAASPRAIPADAEAAARATSRTLHARLQPLIRQLSERVAWERSRRGAK